MGVFAGIQMRIVGLFCSLFQAQTDSFLSEFGRICNRGFWSGSDGRVAYVLKK